MLLYPHHALLRKQAGIVARHRVRGTADSLVVASIDVSSNAGILGRLRELVIGDDAACAS